jgi:hypothetical protein
MKHSIDIGNSNRERADNPKYDTLDLVHLAVEGALVLHPSLRINLSHILNDLRRAPETKRISMLGEQICYGIALRLRKEAIYWWTGLRDVVTRLTNKIRNVRSYAISNW